MRSTESATFTPRHRAGLARLLVLVALLAIAAEGLSRLTPQDPLRQEACEGCHMAGGEVTPGSAELLFSAQEQLCRGCHPRALQASHPSGRAPSMAVPATLPLDWKGDLTCSTCHRIHADDEHGHGALRSALTGKAFCTQCHLERFFTRMADAGTSLVGTGHLDAQSGEPAVALDLYSARCMTCHEKQGGPSGALSVDGRGLVRHDGGTNHPIGVSYREARRFGGYRAREALPATMLLPEGRMSCVSCHLGYSEQHGALVSPRSRSNLCFQCHAI